MQIRNVPKGSWRTLFKWGDPQFFYPIDARLTRFVEAWLGLSEEAQRQPRRPGLDPVRLPAETTLTAAQQTRLQAMLGEENVAVDGSSRAAFTYGSTYVDLLRLRLGQLENVPAAVVRPRDEADLVALLGFCEAEGLPVVPSGGRSSVTQGLELAGSVVVDLTTHMHRVREVRTQDLSAVVQAGLSGPALEKQLNQVDLTCGHFPQSFEFSTVGGWVAARGAGQQSTHYGKIEDRVLALRCVTPRGIVATPPYARAAMGPDLRQALIGSEGAFGVISEVTLQVAPRYRRGQLPLCFFFRSMDKGLTFIRRMVQAGLRPGVCRLSDPEETEIALLLDGMAGGAIDQSLRALGYKPHERVLVIAATEGEPSMALHAATLAHGMALSLGGLPTGGKPLRAWRKRRFMDPYLRDDLMDRGVIIDTLETIAPWSRLPELWQQVRRVVKSVPRRVCMSHISHAYEAGANLYFIFMAPALDADELGAFKAMHGEIVDAIVAAGGALSHHHGVGRLFAPRLPGQLGAPAMGMLRALKGELDPQGIMNPGVFGL